MKDYYQILGVPQDATPDQIKAVYRKLAHIYHPDETVLDKRHATEKFKELNEAYDVLSDSTRRAKYDASYAPGPDGATGAKSTPPQPDISPSHLDFGSVRQGEKRTEDFIVNNLGGPVTDEINLNLSPDPWFQVGFHSKTLPLNIEVSVDTQHLIAGQNYNGWIEVSLDGVTARVNLVLRVLETAPRAERTTAPGTTTCPQCGHVNGDAEVYCQHCAYPLGGKRDCPHCRRVIPARALFCPACRRRV